MKIQVAELTIAKLNTRTISEVKHKVVYRQLKLNQQINQLPNSFQLYSNESVRDQRLNKVVVE